MAEGNGYSLGDILAAINGRGDDFFGGSGFGLIIVLFLFAMMGNGGFGFGGNNQVATSNEVQRGFDNQNSMANQREILNAVSTTGAQAIAATNQAKYDNINVAKDIQVALTAELGRLETAGANILAKQNECCCNTLRAIDGVNYANAQNTAAINANTTAQVQKILDAITGNRMADMQNQINQLSLANQMLGVVKYPMQTTYNSGVNPFCNCGCGCGN